MGKKLVSKVRNVQQSKVLHRALGVKKRSIDVKKLRKNKQKGEQVLKV